MLVRAIFCLVLKEKRSATMTSKKKASNHTGEADPKRIGWTTSKTRSIPNRIRKRQRLQESRIGFIYAT
jgi:hypothetical protein